MVRVLNRPLRRIEQAAERDIWAAVFGRKEHAAKVEGRPQYDDGNDEVFHRWIHGPPGFLPGSSL